MSSIGGVTHLEQDCFSHDIHAKGNSDLFNKDYSGAYIDLHTIRAYEKASTWSNAKRIAEFNSSGTLTVDNLLCSFKEFLTAIGFEFEIYDELIIKEKDEVVGDSEKELDLQLDLEKNKFPYMIEVVRFLKDPLVGVNERKIYNLYSPQSLSEILHFFKKSLMGCGYSTESGEMVVVRDLFLLGSIQSKKEPFSDNKDNKDNNFLIVNPSQKSGIESEEELEDYFDEENPPF